MKVIKDLMHSDELVVELVIRCRVREESVTIGDKNIEDLHYLKTKRDHGSGLAKSHYN